MLAPAERHHARRRNNQTRYRPAPALCPAKVGQFLRGAGIDVLADLKPGGRAFGVVLSLSR
jgi:hypothetical protein